MTRYTTLIEEKNTTIENLHSENGRHKTHFESLNKQILEKLNSLARRPNTQKQDLGELKQLLTSVNKLDRDISKLKQNNQEIISKHEQNFFILKDKLNKTADEMKESKKVETITKTIIEPGPVRERIIHAPPPRTRVVRNLPIRENVVSTHKVVRPSPSPARVYREMPVKSPVHYHNRCTCTCGARNGVQTVKTDRFHVEKCPICNVGYVNTVNNSVRGSRVKQGTNGYFEEQKNSSKMYVEKQAGKIYQSRLSHEPPLKNSVFSNNWMVENSIVKRGEPLKFQKPVRYSVEPLHKRISHKIRSGFGVRKSVREMDPYLISEKMTESENITDIKVRKSVTRKYILGSQSPKQPE